MDEFEKQELDRLINDENKILNDINNSTGPILFPINNKLGFLIDKVPDDILTTLSNHLTNYDLKYSEYLPSNHYSLAGNLQNQYSLPIDNIVEDYIYWLCDIFDKRFPNHRESYYYTTGIETETKLEYDLYSLWINFMKKHEFNPPHTHSGRYSFVIWYKVPYQFTDELLQGPSKRLDKSNLAGAFQFLYPQFSDEGLGFTTIRADKGYEGKICLFPSHLHHSVYPFFTSDDYRISIAGNVRYKNGA